MTAIGELAFWAALSLALWGALAGVLAARGARTRAPLTSPRARRAR